VYQWLSNRPLVKLPVTFLWLQWALDNNFMTIALLDV